MSITFSGVVVEEGRYKASYTDSERGLGLSLFFDHFPSQAELDSGLADYEHSELLASYTGEDRVYKDGVVVRVDVLRDGRYIEGTSTGRRDPYSGAHSSKYVLGKPSSQLLDEWFVGERNDIAGWYGAKTLDSGESFLKVVRYKAEWPNEPEVPGTIWAYASVFSEDGTESPLKDLYTAASADEIRHWCESNGLAYPLPAEVTKRAWSFGVCWDSVTGAIEGVKGYVRYK